jgi:hypothetical protein
MGLQAELEELERVDPAVRDAALGFNQMAERLAITPVASRAGRTERDNDHTDVRLVGVFCDRNCGARIEGQYRARTQAKAYEGLRRDAAAAGWAILANQDLCPACAEHDGCVYPESCCLECHRHKVLHTNCILR